MVGHPEVLKECKRTHEDAYAQMMRECIGLISKFPTRAGGILGDPTIGDTARELSRNQRTAIGESMQGKWYSMTFVTASEAWVSQFLGPEDPVPLQPLSPLEAETDIRELSLGSWYGI